MSHRLRQVRRADEEHIDAVDLQNLFDVADRGFVLELNADQRLFVGCRREVRHLGAEAPIVGARSGRQPTAGSRTEFHRGNCPACVLRGVDVRHLDAHHAAIHDALNIRIGIAARPRDGGDPGGIGGHGHQLDIGERKRTVFAIEQHPVEAGIAKHFDNWRGWKHH
jgi:hypothetical protein